MGWIAPSLAVPSRDLALKLPSCLIWVSGNGCCTASCCREREKHTSSYMCSGNMSELDLLRSSSPSMTYFETVVISRGMPSGLDQCDPIHFVLQAGGCTGKVAYFPFLCRKFGLFVCFPSST